MFVAACVAVGALVGTLILPQYYSNAATTAVSTVFKTATNTTNGSTARSADAPGGAQTGTAKPGDNLKWVVSYQNNTGVNGSVNLKDVISSSGTYVPGSLQLPPNANAEGAITPQYSTNGGVTWANGTPPANSNGLGFTGTVVPQGTSQISVKFPSPVSNVLTTASGDAYMSVIRGGLTYNVYHHRTGPVVYCSKSDGTTCPGWPTNANNQTWSSTVGTPIGTGTEFVGFTANQNGVWISGNKLFWFAGMGAPGSQAPVGTACLDLSTTTPTSCGFQSFGTGIDINSGIGGVIAGTAIAASNGLLYAALMTPTERQLVCITPSTGAPCGTLTVPGTPRGNAVPLTATFGNFVFASYPVAASNWQTYCFSVSTGNLCSGSWPVSTSGSAASAGPPLAPVLSTAGALTGVCSISFSDPGSAPNCWNLSGVALGVNPYAGTGANFRFSVGEGFWRGTKVYLAATNTVICRDFALWSGSGAVPACAGFTPPTNVSNYTVRPALDVSSSCLVATGDSGQITFFNATTGGGCVGVSGPSSITVSPPSYYCGTGSSSFRGWGTLSLPGLVAGTYSNSTVTLRDQNNNVISGFNGVSVAAGATVNLSGIGTSVTSITATVIINGVTDPAGVVGGQIAVTWNGDAPQLCYQTTVPPVSCDAAAPLTLTNSATAVTTSAAGGDSPGGNSSGPTRFTVQATAAQCALEIKKTSSVPSARPGDKVTYTITVKNTGTQAYDNASFTDDLTDVLADATYGGDAVASSGAVAYTAPNLAWSGGLAAGDTATITYSATVKNPDSGDHRMINTVVSPTVGSNCATGSVDANCTSTVLVSDLTVTKTANSSGVASPAKVGDTITYNFSAKNTGQTTLTGVVITDPHVGLSALTYTWPGTAGTLLAGQTVTATATYQLTQADINNAVVPNTATAAGNPPTGPPVTTPPANASVPLVQGPDLSFTKTANSSGVASPAKVGDVISYTFTTTNTGKDTKGDVVVSVSWVNSKNSSVYGRGVTTVKGNAGDKQEWTTTATLPSGADSVSCVLGAVVPK